MLDLYGTVVQEQREWKLRAVSRPWSSREVYEGTLGMVPVLHRALSWCVRARSCHFRP